MGDFLLFLKAKGGSLVGSLAENKFFSSRGRFVLFCMIKSSMNSNINMLFFGKMVLTADRYLIILHANNVLL